jgi:signal peptidase I
MKLPRFLPDGVDWKQGLAKFQQILRDMVVCGMALALFMIFVMQSYAVEGSSMEPTLQSGERVIAEKLTGRFGEFDRGDVVILLFPSDPEKKFVKRIIALPGDTLRIDDGIPTVNGQSLREEYLEPEFRTHENIRTIRIPEGYYFVMGDHRSVSFDSRAFGFVPEKYVQGRVILAFWPPSRIGGID